MSQLKSQVGTKSLSCQLPHESRRTNFTTAADSLSLWCN